MLGFAGNYPCCCPGGPASVTSETSEQTSASTTQTIDVGGCGCIDGIAAETYRIDVSGMECETCFPLLDGCWCEESPGEAGECSKLDATYFVEHFSGCIWRATFDVVCPKCNTKGYSEVRLVLDGVLPSNFEVEVTFGNFTGTDDPRIVFRKNYGSDTTPFDCVSQIDDDIPWTGFIENTTCGACPRCKGENDTMQVSATNRGGGRKDEG